MISPEMLPPFTVSLETLETFSRLGSKDAPATTIPCFSAVISVPSSMTPVIVNIEGGTIQGYSALYEANPEKNEAEAIAKVEINIAAGAFEAINGGSEAVYSEGSSRSFNNCTAAYI